MDQKLNIMNTKKLSRYEDELIAGFPNDKITPELIIQYAMLNELESIKETLSDIRTDTGHTMAYTKEVKNKLPEILSALNILIENNRQS